MLATFPHGLGDRRFEHARDLAAMSAEWHGAFFLAGRNRLPGQQFQAIIGRTSIRSFCRDLKVSEERNGSDAIWNFAAAPRHSSRKCPDLIVEMPR